MSENFSKAQPYLHIDTDTHESFNFIVNKKGDVAIPFRIELPEIYTLGEVHYNTLKSSVDKAFSLFSEEAVFQRQDFFFESKFEGLDLERDGFIHAAHERHFFERGFTDHSPFLYYIIPNKRQIERNVLSSIFFNKGKDQITDFSIRKDAITEFITQTERSIQILADTKLIKIEPLSEKDIRKVMYMFFTLSKTTDSVSDFRIDSNKNLFCGDNQIRIYSVNNAENQPELATSSIRHDEYSTETTRMDVSFLTPLTFELDFNHIVNTIIFKENKDIFLKELETTIKREGSLKFLSSENGNIDKANKGFRKDCEEKYEIPVRFHANVMIWNKNDKQLQKQDNKIITAYNKIGFKPHLEKLTPGIVFWASAPGNGADMPSEESFYTTLGISNCYQNYETNYRSGVNGIVLYDRLTQKPVIVDTWDEPYKQKVIANRNCIVIGPSGEGKSVLFNHIFSQYTQQNFNLVILDIGNSYKKLCEIFNGKYLVYDINDPIPFNPFLIKDNKPTGDDIDFLINLLFICWQKKERSAETNAILKKSISAYYNELRKDSSVFPDFLSFYKFIENTYSIVIKQEFKEIFFDLDSFLLVLEDFATGTYKHLFNSKTTLNVKNDNLIVFELDNIKDHPILFPVVALIITHTIDQTVFKAKGVKKAIWMDEAWKIIEKEGMDHYMKYLFKTLRKHQGQVGIIIHNITDLPDNAIGNAIINNCDNKILLSHKKNQDMIPQLAKRLSLTENAKGIFASATSDLKNGYTEFFYQMGNLSKVYRLELSKESYWAFTSDEDDNMQINQKKEAHGTMELAIKQLTEDQNSTL